MKFTITMKSPDAVHDAVDNAARDIVKSDSDTAWDEFTEEEEYAVDVEATKLYKLLQKWFKYNEYLTVEVDTEAETIRVVER